MEVDGGAEAATVGLGVTDGLGVAAVLVGLGEGDGAATSLGRTSATASTTTASAAMIAAKSAGRRI